MSVSKNPFQHSTFTFKMIYVYIYYMEKLKMLEKNRNCINYVATCKLDKKNILTMTIKHHMSL